MDRLRVELRRQIDGQLQLESQKTAIGDINENKGLVTFRSQPTSFRDSLENLERRILDGRVPTISTASSGSEMCDASLLWKIPAFCQPTAYVIDPDEIIARSDAIQSVRSARDTERSNVDNIWDSNRLQSWIFSGKSELLLVQGRYKAIHHLERFGLEMTKFLRYRMLTVFMLVSTLKPIDNNIFGNMQPQQVIRQLVIQALQKIIPPRPISFLADVFERFQTSNSVADWLETLQCVVRDIGEVFIVLDMGVFTTLGHEASSLPAVFQSLVEHLQSSSAILKVMLLSSRSFNVEASISTTHMVLEKNMKPFRPERLSATQDRLALGFMPSSLKMKADRMRNDFGKGEQMVQIPSSHTTSPAASANSVCETSARILPGIPASTLANHFPPSSQHQELEPHIIPLSNACRKDNQTSPRVVEKYFTCREEEIPNLSGLKSVIGSLSSNIGYRDMTVAIICALTLEADAVLACFDEHLDDDLIVNNVRGDTNAYSIGKIGRHNVVLVYMSGMGKGNAAIAATNCKGSFPGITLALLVGVCGGVPSITQDESAEIVLGDIVISEGLVPFDYGRQYPDKFSRKDGVMDTFGKPPPAIRALLKKLGSRVGRRWLKQRTLHYLNALTDGPNDDAVYPGATEDRLFESNYLHKHHPSSACTTCNEGSNLVCESARTTSCQQLGCDVAKLVSRSRLQQQSSIQPTVHFGLIASGDQVMKSGEHRDSIASKEGVIAFEMEAAGVWESFPCLVIKGVCDYADSHKSKRWQSYAATTAAACMKAFLEKWSGST